MSRGIGCCSVALIAVAAGQALGQDEAAKTITGHVYLPDGVTPAPGGHLFAELVNTERWHNAPPITVPAAVQSGGVGWAATIGDDGAFSLPCNVNTPAGDPALYFVQVNLAGYPPLRSRPVAPGEEVELLLSAGQPVRGVVTGPDGEPRAGVRVTAYWPNYRGGGFYAGEMEPRYGQVATSETAGDGSYELGPLAAGLYDLWATADDLAPVGQFDVAVTADAPAQLDLESPLPAEIAGRVAYLGTDEPMEGIKLWIYMDEPREHRRTFSARDGSFRLASLPGGAITLRARKEGLAPRVMDLDIAEGEAREEIIEMCEGGVIDVWVMTEDGEPVADAEVSLRQTSWTEGGAERRRLTMVGRTDADGRVRVEHLWPQEYGIMAVHRELGHGETESLPVEDRQTQEVDVVIGE